MDYDYLVFIGRFQPFHLGHLAVLKDSLKKAKQVILLPGSADQPRSLKNPWTVDERENMIRPCFSLEDNSRIHIKGLVDIPDNDELWVSDVQKLVSTTVAETCQSLDNKKIGLIGYLKDNSSEYLKLFPQWDFVEVKYFLELNATDIRNKFFTLDSWSTSTRNEVHANVRDWLKAFSLTSAFDKLLGEKE